jgi:hypothetical protein
MLAIGKSRNPQLVSRVLRSASAFAAAVFAVSGSAQAAYYYWSGDQSSGGSVTNPITGTWPSSTTSNWYQDSAGTTPWGVGVSPASATTTQIQFGGAAGSSAYTVNAGAAITINNITLDDLASVTDTLNFTLTGSSKLAMSTNTSTSPSTAAGFVQSGSANWNILNGGAANAPIRFNNSFTISGAGSGNIDLDVPLANNSSSSTYNFSINETGGSTITLPVSNTSMGGSGKSFTLTNGTVDFQNGLALGNAAMAVNLNGGTLQSSTGTTLSTYTGGINLGSAITFAGPVNWSLGAGAVSVAAASTITANTAGSSGTTIAGAITGAGGITLASGSTGAITFTNASDAYTGATTINGGTLFDNGDITASAVTINSPGILAGDGTLGLPVTNYGIIAPGASTGTADLSFVSGLGFSGSLADYNADVDAAGQSDDLTVTGNLNLGTGTTLNVNVLDSTSGGAYTIATYTGTLTGTFATTNLPAGYSINYGSGTDSAITLVVPEPASLSLLAIGAAVLIRRRRR